MRQVSLMLLCALVFGTVGCGQQVREAAKKPNAPVSKTASGPAPRPASEPARESRTVTSPSKPDGDAVGLDESIATPAPVRGGELASTPATVGPAVGSHRSKSRRAPAPPAGLLTAGSFDDNLNPDFFRVFADRMVQHPHLAKLPERFRASPRATTALRWAMPACASRTVPAAVSS
jgi:hypothetical protein